jgi:triacylglycerol lipase
MLECGRVFLPARTVMITLLMPGFPDPTRLPPSRAFALEYFVGVRKMLTERGFEVPPLEFGAFESVRKRADRVAQFLNGQLKDEKRKVHIIAHSAGGVAARFLVSPQGRNLAHRVRSITAVGTPHDGTPIADHFLEAEQLQEKVLGLEREFPGFRDGVRELTIKDMAAFNAEINVADDFPYFTYAGSTSSTRLPFTFFGPFQKVLEKSGDNDGWVPTSSTQRGKFHKPVENADHAQLVGWDLSPGFFGVDLPLLPKYDHLDLYRRIADEIAPLGE